MTKKTLGYVQLEWTCPYCQTHNPGPRKFCNGCGSAQPEDIEFHQAPDAQLLTDAEEITRAKAGPDVHCPYCRARNPGDAKFCGACGGDLSGAEVRETGQVVGAYQSEAPLDVECPSCGTMNTAAARECAGCGDRLPRAEEAKPAAPSSQPRRTAIPVIIILGVLGVCLIGGLLGFLLLGRTEEQTAVVDQVEWTRSIAIEALQEVEDQAWQDELPSDADVVSCSTEYRTTQDEPSANSIEVCGTPYTIDTGSGYGEVVQDCMYEVYDELCTYTALEWTVFDTATATGTDLNPAWPGVSLSGEQREGDRDESYVVYFLSEGDQYIYRPDTEGEFQEFPPGTQWLIAVNALGSVVSVERP